MSGIFASLTDSWARGLGAAGIIVGLVSLGVAIFSLCTTRQINRLNLNPDLTCYFAQGNERAWEFSIRNTSPLSAKMVSVRFMEYRYDTKRQRLITLSEQGHLDKAGDNWIFIEELTRPNPVSREIWKLPGFEKDLIFMYVFNLTWHHPTDLRAINKTVTFFTEGNQIYRERDFWSRPEYRLIRRKVETAPELSQRQKDYMSGFVSE